MVWSNTVHFDCHVQSAVSIDGSLEVSAVKAEPVRDGILVARVIVGNRLREREILRNPSPEMLVQPLQNGIPVRVIFVRLRIVVDNSFFLRRKSVPRPVSSAIGRMNF